MKTCFDCKSEIPVNANVCKYCGTRVQGLLCPDCLSFCPSKAKVCKWCGTKLLRTTKSNVITNGFSIESEFLPTLLLELKFTPQKAKFSADKIVVTSYSLFGLISHEEEFPWHKLAGFTHKSGLFWDQIYIETRGQTGAYIKCLAKHNSSRIKKVLQKLEK